MMRFERKIVDKTVNRLLNGEDYRSEIVNNIGQEHKNDLVSGEQIIENANQSGENGSGEKIDDNSHISLTCNLFFIIAATLILTIIGTIIIEKINKVKIKEKTFFINKTSYYFYILGNTLQL